MEAGLLGGNVCLEEGYLGPQMLVSPPGYSVHSSSSYLKKIYSFIDPFTVSVILIEHCCVLGVLFVFLRQGFQWRQF